MDSTVTIPEWFRNRDVLVTGGTGFMGKVLLHKLLSSCPNIANIYVIIREKRGIDPKSRLTAILQQEPFKAFHENNSDALKKVVAMPGDTLVEGLNLSTANKDIIINKVSVVFHMAANVRFDLSLKTSVTLNTRSTAHMLALAKQMTQLQSYVHVSTAYCHCGEEVLEERYYPTSVKPENVLSLIETTSEDLLEEMTPGMLGKEPNPYAYSKVLSEDLVAQCELPIGIARPSIVIPSWKEPLEGWVENMNGPTGLIVAGAKGVMRTMLIHEDNIADVIPCDMTINALIAFAWKVGITQLKIPLYLNITESTKNQITWQEMIEKGLKYALKYPLSGLLWYPGGGPTSNKITHYILVLMCHMLPAYFLDAILYLTGNKPFMLRVHEKINLGSNLLQYYTTKQWNFRNDGLMDLEQMMCPEDRKIFFINTNVILWDDYILSAFLGVRKYCLKDDPSTIPKARRILRYYYIADVIVKTIFFLLLAWFAYSCFKHLRIPYRTMIEVKRSESL